jgi:hypothetical protein
MQNRERSDRVALNTPNATVVDKCGTARGSKRMPALSEMPEEDFAESLTEFTVAPARYRERF